MTYVVRAVDAVDGPLTATCSPTAGEDFPLGTTTVACTASDAAGNETKGDFEVIVRDTTAPELTLPGPIEVEAGAELEYTVTARDVIEGSLAPSCSVEPGTAPDGGHDRDRVHV